jgi:hypothetical protein
LIPSPVQLVLAALKVHDVRSLLMGGQACVLYGAAEFSRDTDLAIRSDRDNLARLRSALRDLGADSVEVPPFEARFLERGHAVHFRCTVPGADGMRIDVMARLRGLPEFPTLWERRTTFTLGDPALAVEVMSLADLVAAKKTRRDKDWPMIRRLLEAHYWSSQGEATRERAEFWFRELRTPELLIDCARAYPDLAGRIGNMRPAVAMAVRGDLLATESALEDENACRA